MQKKRSSMKKRIFAMLLASVMAFSSTATAFATDEIIDAVASDAQADASAGTADETDNTDGTSETAEATDEASETVEITIETAETALDTTESTEAMPAADSETAEVSEDDEPFEEIHYVSDLEGEGMLPYEYYIIDCSDLESSETGLDLNRVPSYNSSQTKYNSSFAYNALSSDEQELYDAIYALANTIDCSADYDATNMENYGGYFFEPLKYADTAATKDTLYKVYVAITNDNPQFFWMGHSYLSGSNSDGAFIYFGIDSADFADGADRMTIKSSLYKEIEDAIEGAAAYGNEYTKEWYIHNYLCDKTEYVLNAEHAHNITGLLLEGEAVCESYAKCFQLFMNALGIDVMYITGLGNGGAHAWNQIGLDNNGVTEWYNVDVTWDDSDSGYNFYYFNAVDSDGTQFDFVNGTLYNGSMVNAHEALTEGEDEYIYPAKSCNSTTYSYANHSTNYKLASVEPVAKIGETEYTSLGAAIEASTAGQTITLLADTSYTGTAMPEHPLTIDCAGFCLEFDRGMDMYADLTIANLNGYDFDKLYEKGYIDLYSYNYIYLNDNTLTLSGASDNYLPALISGYMLNEDETESYESGIVQIDLDDDCYCALIQVVGIDGLTIADNEDVNIHYGFDAGDVVIGNEAALSIDHGYGEIGSLSIAESSCLRISSSDPEPYFTIYDTISANVVNVAAANMEVGLASVVTRLKYPVDMFNFVYITADSETEYKVSRLKNGDNLYLYFPFDTDDFTISNGNVEAKRCTFPEAVEWIDEQNDASKDYTITYTGDYTNLIVNNDLIFGNANSITFDGININLTGDITLNTDITFDYGGAFWGVLYGNDHTITFADNDTISGFNNAYAENLNVVVLNSSVSFLDDSKSGNDIQLNTLTLNGDTDIGYAALDKLTVDKLFISDINNNIIFNSGKAEIGDIICEGSCAFNIKNGDVLTVNGSTFDGNPIEFYSENPQSGQKLITVSEDISGFFTTYVQNANGDTYSVIYREGTLVLDIPVFDLQGVGIYSQWSDILSYINKNGSSAAEFTVELLDNVVLDSFTLPAATKAKAIDFIGAYDITLNSTTLSVPTNVTFDCALDAENTSITVVKGMQLDIADGNVKDLTGTATSTLCGVHIKTDSVKTFGAIDIYKLVVNETMSGVTNFAGELVLKNSTSPVTITNITDNSKISYQTGSTLPKVTISKIAEGAALTINVNDGAALAGGTTVLYCTSDISDKVSIENTTENGKVLSPIYYASTKSIKAEDASAVTMQITDANGSTTTRSFPTIELALAAVKDITCDYTITLNQEFTLSALTLPKTAKSITFMGEDITFTGKTLNIPVDITFDCDLIAKDTSVKITAKKAVFSNLLAKDITGTKTTEIITRYAAIQVQNLKTFGKLSGTFVVFGSATGIAEIGNGVIAMYSPTGKADIAKITGDATIAYCTGDILPKVTVTDIADDASLIIDVNERADLASGTTVLYTKGQDLSEHITITNQTADGKPLSPFYYSKTKSIKAEWADAMTLSYGDQVINLPNIDKVFEVINANKDSTMDYTITLNTPLTLSSLTIPKYANKIQFEGETLTYTGKSLTIPVDMYFSCDLVAANTAIKITAKNVTFGKTLIAKDITGTKTTQLRVENYGRAQNIKTFGKLDGTYQVDGSVSGITEMGNGSIEMYSPKGKADIANITDYVTIIYFTGDVLPKVTVTDIAEDAKLIINVNGNEYLASGTTVLYTKGKDLSGRVSIVNKTTDMKPLTAFYYAKTKSIKAEWADMITLSDGNESKNYPNIDKVIEAINAAKDTAADYTITLNSDITISALSLPKYANSYTFKGDALNFTGNTIKLPVSTYFECELNAPNAALTASKDLSLGNASLKSLTGAKTSALNITGKVATASLKTFASIDAAEGELVIDGSASGITSFIGNLTATSKAAVTITNAQSSYIKYIADSIGAIGKVTITNTAEDAQFNICVADENDSTISLASGTPILYCSSDISSNVTITNKTSSDNTLSASYYLKKKAIYAEYANAVAVSYSTANGDVNENYSSFEKAFAAIPVSAEGININLNCDVLAESFTVPKFVNGLAINGLVNTVTLKNLASISLAVPATFNDVTINSTKSFKINTTNSLTLSSFASSTLSAITGKATRTLSYNGENDVNYTISGFGTLDLRSGPVLNISKAVTVKNILADNNAVLGIMDGANVKLTTVDTDDALTIKYYDDAKTPVSISGIITGNILFTHEASFTDGQQLLTAAKAELAGLSFEEENLPDDRDYILTAKSGKIYLKAIAFEVSDGTNDYRYAEWADFVAMVNAEKNAEAVYTVTLTGDHNVGAALTMPKAGTYSKIVISSPENENYTLSFTGGIKLTGELELENISLASVNKKGAAAAYTITTGKYSLTATNVDFGTGASISGSTGSVITLDGCILSGKLTAADAVLCDTTVTGAAKTTKMLTIDGQVFFNNTVNAYGINGSGTLTLTKGKLLTVGKGGTGEGTIYISLGDTVITAKTKLGTITKGYYNDNFVGDGLTITIDGAVINANPIA